MQEILINSSIHEARVAVLEDGTLQELRIEKIRRGFPDWKYIFRYCRKSSAWNAVGFYRNRPSSGWISSCRKICAKHSKKTELHP